MYDYDDCIKCGEILLSPSITDKDQYILKCGDCDEYYIELELFIPHWASHYTDSNDNNHVESDESEAKVKSETITIEDENSVDPLTSPSLKFYIDSDEEMNDDVKITLHEPDIMLQHNVGEKNVDDSHNEVQLSDFCKETSSKNMETDVESLNDAEGGNGNDDGVDDDDSKLSTFVQNFMASKLNVLTFIAAYKNQPHLWDTELSSHVRSKQRPIYLEKIASEFKKKRNVSISMNQLRAVISHLRYRYRNTVKNSNISNPNSKKDAPIWYFKYLTFLPSPVENDSLTTIGQCKLLSKQIIQILKTYEKFPHLWNSNLIENYCNNKRHEALANMQSVLKSKMGLKIDEKDLNNYINCIHIHCTKEKRISVGRNKTEYRSQYIKHMLYLYDHVAPFSCSICNQKTLNALKLKVHQSDHDGSIPLECSICQKAYYNTEPYVAHIRRHMDDLNVECKECGKRFLRLADLTVHMRAHTGAKPFCCEYCGASFRHGNAFLIHKRRHEKNYLHKCPICTKGFYEMDKMKIHIDTHKKVGDRMCTICGKSFKTKTTLKTHILTHEEGRTHPCKLCGKMFKNRIGVYQHMRTHRNKEPDIV